MNTEHRTVSIVLFNMLIFATIQYNPINHRALRYALVFNFHNLMHSNMMGFFSSQKSKLIALLNRMLINNFVRCLVLCWGFVSRQNAELVPNILPRTNCIFHLHLLNSAPYGHSFRYETKRLSCFEFYDEHISDWKPSEFKIYWHTQLILSD